MTTASVAPSASISAMASCASVSWSASPSGIAVGRYPRMKGLTARYPLAAMRERRSSQVWGGGEAVQHQHQWPRALFQIGEIQSIRLDEMDRVGHGHAFRYTSQRKS